MKLHSVAIIVSSVLATPLAAADLRSKSRPPAAPEVQTVDIPGDIFGFTSATGVGSVGDLGLALENDGRFGKRSGSYSVVTQKLELGYTFAENWSIAGSVFGNMYRVRDVAIFPDKTSGYGFDGLSFEVRHRLIERTATQPFALTFALEPRWARIDGAGFQSNAVGIEAKVQIDAPISDRLFWAMNANFATVGQEDPATKRWSSVSATTLSSAISYAVIEDKLFLGAEARWLHAFDSTVFGALEGQALFFGPTLMAKITPNASFNVTVQPQIAGKARGVPGNLDLDGFERTIDRAKLAIGF